MTGLPTVRAYGKSDNTPTPSNIYSELDKEFNFNFDPCPLNPDGMRQFDGLISEWKERNFVNPPWSKKLPWIKKAIEEQAKGRLTVMWLPVDTTTDWFHDLILPNAEVRWIKHIRPRSFVAIFRVLFHLRGISSSVQDRVM